ncbi:hypothetical protein AVEN_98462-1 [Araneus ventricosus]|uniref:CRAL/TRIO N-terminal domain-containing protein n=1 Tax=Araneus ventricosus TaxID=182803 RepID=A0A4Y2S0F3_ARAVE|nr:hypothetical protein AVEN_98462-1 [Araneus ventricosus]
MSDSNEDKSTLPLEINYIPDYIYEKYKENSNCFHENKDSYMQELKKLLQDDKLSENIDFEEDFLQLYLMQCKNDATKAFSKIRNYLKLRRDYTFFYQGVKFDFTSHPSCQVMTPLPHRLSDGSVIFLFEIGTPIEPSNSTSIEAGVLTAITDHGPTPLIGGKYYHWREVTQPPPLLYPQEKQESAYVSGSFSSVNLLSHVITLELPRPGTNHEGLIE